MRLNEILKESAERLESLKAAIEAGEKPVVAAATYAAGSYGWGDLEKLGFAERHQRVISRQQGIVEEWWEYKGPKPIMAQPYMGHPPVEMRAGETTPAIEVDYS
jgi:hypothetical protein